MENKIKEYEAIEAEAKNESLDDEELSEVSGGYITYAPPYDDDQTIKVQ